MKRARAIRRLAELGYEIDWSVTGPEPDGCGWSGTFDAIGRNCIDGDCRGEVVFGNNAPDFYKNAVSAAEGYAKPEACPYPLGECPFHDH